MFLAGNIEGRLGRIRTGDHQPQGASPPVAERPLAFVVESCLISGPHCSAEIILAWSNRTTQEIGLAVCRFCLASR
jgi:hypothetical protein